MPPSIDDAWWRELEAGHFHLRLTITLKVDSLGLNNEAATLLPLVYDGLGIWKRAKS